jgi:acetyl-CoA C-acetyltransferase/acetyl-CoA acyltransferase
MERLAIIDGIRTPFCKAGSVFKDLTAVDLARGAVSELSQRLELDLKRVDHVIFGNVAQPPDAANIARVIALRAGIPERIPAVTVHRNCASGMEAITSAYEKMMAGHGEVMLVGGMESMSNIPLLFRKSAVEKFAALNKAKSLLQRLGVCAQFRPSDFNPIVGVMLGLTDPVCGLNMGQTAEVLYRDFQISREEQDQFALGSHRKATAARAKLREEIVTVYVPPQFTPVQDDNGVRENQTMEALAKLRPVFEKGGTVTAGNASQLTDGAVALLVTTEKRAKDFSSEPLGYLRAYAYAGLDPRRMGLGPAFAIPLALKQAKLSLNDVQLWEINEAFSVQVLASLRALTSKRFCKEHLGMTDAFGEINRDLVNVNGGAVALGHPVGASGARLVLTLLKEMKRRNLETGVAALCVGGGQGAALVLERK